MIAGTTITNGQSIIKSTTGRDGQSFTLGQINLKAEKVEVQKTTPGDLLSQIGSSHEFTITTNVPNYGDYQDWTNPQFSISDTPTSNLTTQFGADNAGIGVKANGVALTSGTDYTVTKAANGNGFTVTLSNPLKQSGNAITVTYTAVVNAVGVDKTNNTASVTFDNNPQDHSSHGTGTTDSTKHLYVASVPLQKIAFSDPNTILLGAQFTVTAGTANTPVKFHDYGNGVYGIVKDGAVDAQGNPVVTVDHITSSDTQIVIKGPQRRFDRRDDLHVQGDQGADGLSARRQSGAVHADGPAHLQGAGEEDARRRDLQHGFGELQELHGFSLFGVGGLVGWRWLAGSLGVWIPRCCSPPPCSCLILGGFRAWSSVTGRAADANCTSRSASTRPAAKATGTSPWSPIWRSAT